jgi:class III poly(R)-hydroxyalkanoic acid synthase PhaE subunit
MDWTKQAEVMMETWTEAQKKMWENWFEMAQNGSGSTMFPNMTDQWRILTEQSIQAWMSGSAPTAKKVMEQWAAGHSATMRFMELSTKAWQAMAPKVEAGENWQAILADYSNQWFKQLAGDPGGLAHAGEDLNSLWRLYMEQWQKLLQSWQKYWGQTPWQFSQAILGNGTQLDELNRLHWDVYERSFGRITETPLMGFNRELMAKIIHSFDTWVEFRQASTDYHILLAKTWIQAFEQVMTELVAFSENGKQIDSIRELMNLWMDTVDHTFSKLYKAEEYLEVQQKLVSAGMRYRLKEQEITEIILKTFNLPTRSELDDAYRSLYELRKEVKVLKKALKERGDTGQIKAAPAPKKAPRKPAAKTKAAANQDAADEPVPDTAGGSKRERR